MTQYNTLNVKLFNLQLNKLKPVIQIDTGATLNVSSHVVGDFNGETNFLHKSPLTNTQVSRLRKAFVNRSSSHKKFSKTQLFKMVQLGGSIFDEMLGPFNPFKILNSIDNSV